MGSTFSRSNDKLNTIKTEKKILSEGSAKTEKIILSNKIDEIAEINQITQNETDATSNTNIVNDPDILSVHETPLVECDSDTIPTQNSLENDPEKPSAITSENDKSNNISEKTSSPSENIKIENSNNIQSTKSQENIITDEQPDESENSNAEDEYEMRENLNRIREKNLEFARKLMEVCLLYLI